MKCQDKTEPASAGLALYLLASVIAFVLVTHDLYQGYRQHMEDAKRSSINLASSMDNHLNTLLDKTNLILQKIVSGITPEMLGKNSAEAKSKVNAELKFILDRLPESQSLRVVSKEGYVIFDASGTPPTGNVADRKYFLENKNNPHAGLVVSEAIFARFTNNWVITLSRQIRSPDGEFLGLVQAAVRAEFFERFYNALSTGSNGLLSLYDSEMKNFVRSPHIEGFTGSKKFSPELVELLKGDALDSFYVANSASDNIRRLLRFQRSDKHRFTIITGISMHDILSKWYERCVISFSMLFALYYMLWKAYFAQQRRYQLASDMADAMTQKAVDALEIGNKSRQSFLSAISHEFRTPLNGILGITEYLIHSGLPENHRQSLDLVMLSAKRLNNMVDDLLDYLDADNPDTINTCETFSITQLLESIHSRYFAFSGEKGLQLTTRKDPGLDDVYCGDYKRIERIIGILMGNAIKFTHQGFVDLSVSASALIPGALQFVVTDTGVGMDKEARQKIFEIFSQASAGNTRSHEGLGIGLCLAGKLANQVQARIEVSSEESSGTKFTLTLPPCGHLQDNSTTALV